jgi:hypothetical protein
MAINPALLISAAILQDYFSDNATDTAMSAGVITCYQDNSRTTLKNWYYQSGSPGAYTYVPLDNPLTLSAAGTITDPNGNDTIPFWYPYSELDNETPQPYYVTVDNSNGQRQFTRQNFPFVSPANSSSENPTFKNLIVNNVFWRNKGTSITLTDEESYTLAPSQHDGYLPTMADITFIKNATGAMDVISFNQFATDQLTGDANPEYYLNFQCSSSGSSETLKYIQIPIALHLANLNGYSTASVSIWCQNVGGSTNNTLTLTLYPFLGTGNSVTIPNPIGTITASTTWQKKVFNFAFPTQSIPISGSPGDDAWFLLIGFPVGVQFNMNIAKPSVYLSTTIPSDDFDTYEYVSGTIDSPRTGDVRTSLNTYQPFGWVPMNNGTIGNASSSATARANIDTWPLFSLIWNQFSAYTNGTTNVLAQMVNSSGSHVAYGASAIADWNANNSIALTQTMGKVILGTVPVPSLTNAFTNTFTASNSGGNLLITSSGNINTFTGMPVYFENTGGSLPGGLSANTIYYVATFTTNAFSVATSFANAIAGTVIAYSSAGSGTNTFFEAFNNTVEGEYAHTQLLAELAAHTHTIPVGTGASTSTVGNNGAANTGTANTGSTGSSTPFNVTQPGVFLNLYMKL